MFGANVCSCSGVYDDEDAGIVLFVSYGGAGDVPGCGGGGDGYITPPGSVTPAGFALPGLMYASGVMQFCVPESAA